MRNSRMRRGKSLKTKMDGNKTMRLKTGSMEEQSINSFTSEVELGFSLLILLLRALGGGGWIYFY